MILGVGNFTELLESVSRGNRVSSDQLLPLVYDELRSLAAMCLLREEPGQTLQPTALVHEAYLRLVGGASNPTWENRRHFFAAAAEAMRRILVDRARRKATVKHGGAFRRLDFDVQHIVENDRSAALLALDEALSELERHDANAADFVKLRYFAGLTHKDAAAALQITPRVADRWWALAKAWLYERLCSD